MGAVSSEVYLLDRLSAAGDDGAWSEFDARYGDLITRAARRRGLQSADVEDVRQTVMMGLLRTLPRLRFDPTRGRLGAYLERAVRNAVTRSRSRLTKTVPLDETALGGRSAESGFGAGPSQDRARDTLHQVRSTTNSRDMAVFERLTAGCSIREVAKDEGLTEGAVYKIRQRTRDRLRRLI